MNNAITTYGGGEIFYYVFQGIATILGGGGLINGVIRLTAIVGIIWALLLMNAQNSLDIGVRWFLWFLVVTNVFFLPKTTVWIKDPLVYKSYKVDNVPLALGVFASAISSIGHNITEKMEEVFTLPDTHEADYMQYHKTGTVFASRLMSQANQFKILDPDFNANMEKFVNQCVVYDAMIGHKYTIKDLQESTDIWALVRGKSSGVLGFLYKESGNDGEIVTCREGANRLEKLWRFQIDLAAQHYGARFSRNGSASAKRDFLTYLPQSYNLLTKMALSAQKILQQEMMINAITDSSNNKVSELGGSTNYASTKALLQQRSTYQISGEMARQILPIMKNVFEALAYVAFIFIFILALLPNGHRILGSYISLLMWIQMWAPLYAVLNLFMTLSARYNSVSVVGNKGLNMVTSVGLANVNADTEALAGWLSMSIPAISYVIVKGGAAAFVNLAGHLGSAMQSAASSTAHEVTSGNFSLGNVSQGVIAMQNTSGFQHNLSPSFRDGQFERNIEDGTIKVTQPDGSQIFRGGAGHNTSQLRVRPHTNENWSRLAQDQISHNNAVIQSQSQELSEAKSIASRQVVSLATAMGKGQSSSQGYDRNVSVGENSVFQDSKNFTKTIQDQYSLNENQAAEVAASVVVGGGTPGILKSLTSMEIRSEGKGSLTSKADRSAIASDIHTLAEGMNLNNSLERAVRTAKDIKFNDSQSTEARLVDDISSSMDKVSSARDNISKAQQHSDSYTKFYSMSKSGAFNTDRDESQELLEYTANQMDNGRRIGMDGAYRILNSGGYKADEIISHYREDKWNSIKSQIESSDKIQTDEDIKRIYENANIYQSRAKDYSLGDASGVEQIDAKLDNLNPSSIRDTAQVKGLESNNIINMRARDHFNQASSELEHKITQKSNEVAYEERQIKRSTSRKMGRNVAVLAVENAAKPVVEMKMEWDHLVSGGKTEKPNDVRKKGS